MPEHTVDSLAWPRPTPDPRDPRASSLLQQPDGSESLAGRLALVGLPYDAGIPSRPGARFGPRALRDALGAFSTYSGERELKPVLDLGDLALPSMHGSEAHARIEGAARELFAAGASPLFVGGDHGCTGSVVRGLAAARPKMRLALINIDAHLDVREYDNEQTLSSGTPFRRALETSVLTGSRTAMLGLRRFANSRRYAEWARAQGVHLFSVEDVQTHGAASIAHTALGLVMEEEVDGLYLSIDLDAADVSVAPGVSAQGIGGLSATEMIQLVRAVASHPRLVGMDIMELSPPYDPDGRTARLAARLVLEAIAVRAR